MMRCEVCGRSAPRERLTYVVIEGAKLLACSKCASLGAPKIVGRALPKRRAKMVVSEEMEPVPDCAELIRSAREKLGLSQVDLAKKIGEKVSVVKRLEQGKISPDSRLSTKLEHSLRIKLYMSKTEPPIESISRKREFSIGDLAKVKRARRLK